MTEVGIIALVVLAFIAGAITGVIMISLCVSNDRYDDEQAAYNMGVKNGVLKGRNEMRKEAEELCSHCAYYGRKEND